MKDFVTVIIVAAGNSTRMGLNQNKTLLEIAGKKAIYYSLLAYSKSSYVDEIIIVTKEENIKEMEEVGKEFDKFKKCVVGGASRTESIYNGVNAASDSTTYFAFHDGARPLVNTSDIDKAILKAKEVGASTLGCKVTDTIKMVDDNSIISKTVDREKLYTVQTPQVFEKNLYLTAMQNAKDKNIVATDDCYLLEILGKDVAIVEGSKENIKLTTQNDIIIAKAILERR